MRFIFQNKSGEVYPAYGCGRLKSILSTDEASGNPVFELVKPDGEDGVFVVNGPNNIASDDFGVGISLDSVFLVLIDDGSTEDAPAFGNVCGPTEGRWAATTAGDGLRATGEVVNRVMPVIPTSGSGGGSHSIMFRVVDVYCKNDEDNDEGVFFVLAECEEYTSHCGIDPPGLDAYTGYLKIYDTCVLETYYTAYGLAGRTGYATYFYPRRNAEDDPSYSPCLPKWRALSLCGEPECG